MHLRRGDTRGASTSCIIRTRRTADAAVLLMLVVSDCCADGPGVQAVRKTYAAGPHTHVAYTPVISYQVPGSYRDRERLLQ